VTHAFPVPDQLSLMVVRYSVGLLLSAVVCCDVLIWW
jgi:hypothetical protein